MESSILSEVDDTSFSGRGSPRRYGCPLNWLPTSRLLPRAAGWSAATLCIVAVGPVGLWATSSVIHECTGEPPRGLRRLIVLPRPPRSRRRPGGNRQAVAGHGR